MDISSVSQQTREATAKIFLSCLLSFTLFSFLLYLYSTVMLRRLERDQRARERSEQRARELSELARAGTLLAGLSHQLRNPIAILKGVVSALAKREILPEQAPFVKALGEEVKRLGDLVEAFLRFAQPLNNETSDHPTYLREQISAAVEKVEKRYPHATFVVDVSSDVATSLRPDLVHEIILNLFCNSVEATPPEIQPHISIVLSEQEKSVVLLVTDNGEGFAEDMLFDYKLAFKPFHTTKQTGTGLGLALIKRIVDEVGGTIELSNTREGGARVKLSLPRWHY